MNRPTSDDFRNVVIAVRRGRDVDTEKLARAMFALAARETFEEFAVDSPEVGELTLTELEVLMECTQSLAQEARKAIREKMEGAQN